MTLVTRTAEEKRRGLDNIKQITAWLRPLMPQETRTKLRLIDQLADELKENT
jgi:hypothetical protein